MNQFKFIENYLYIYQLKKYVILPTFPDSINDSLGSTFSSTNILSRTAPIYAYSYSGPRKVTLNITLHRDMMASYNYSNRSFLEDANVDEDYVDVALNYLQAMALPTYKANEVVKSIQAGKIVNPPLVAIRFGNEVWVKGVISGDVSVEYSGSINENGKYQMASLTVTVLEVDPQDAETVAKWGSFRSLGTNFTDTIAK